MRIKSIKIPSCAEVVSNCTEGPVLSVALCPKKLPKIATADNIQAEYGLDNTDIEMVWELTAYTEQGGVTSDSCLRGDDSSAGGAVFVSYLEFVTGLNSGNEGASDGRHWVLFPPYYSKENCLNSKAKYSGITKGPCLPNTASPEYLYTPTFIPYVKTKGSSGGTKIECEDIAGCLADPNMLANLINNILNNTDILNNLTNSIVNNILNNTDILNKLVKNVLEQLKISGGNFITVTGSGDTGFTIAWNGEVGPCPEDEGGEGGGETSDPANENAGK